MDERLETEVADEPVAEPAHDTVDVRFRIPGRAGAFDASGHPLLPHDPVIVETDRGPELGEVVGPLRARWPQEIDAKLPRILRVAGVDDLRRAEHNREQEGVARHHFVQRARELGLALKLVRVDCRFDGGKAVFYFMSPKRVDFRGLVRDLAQTLHTRVEMRQIGERDETRLIGGIGPCGRELCCSSWLREFDAVSIKMAKAQDLSLNPSKLAGMCGRLKCCLRYEYDTYVTLRRALPKVGARVQTIHGEGQVVKQLTLKQRILVRTEDSLIAECSLEDLVARKTEAAGDPAAEQPPSQEPGPRPHPEVSGEPSSERRTSPAAPGGEEDGSRRRRRGRRRPRGGGPRGDRGGGGGGSDGGAPPTDPSTSGSAS